jgi:hypothetical protein
MKGKYLNVDNNLLGRDPGPIFRPSNDIDPENPFMRKRTVLKAATRKCKKCGKEFTLHGDYDPDNWTHDLCSDCILTAPTTNQSYIPERELAE